MDPNLLMQVVSARVLSDDGASNQLAASSDDGVRDLTLFPSSTSPAGGSLEKPAIASNGVGITSKAPLPTAATSLLAAMADAHLYAQMLPSSSTGVNMFAASVHHATKYLQPQPLQVLARNSTKTLKCPKCNWHYKYQETLEIHMKEKHFEGEVNCLYCTQNQPHPKLARGESYSCGYKPYRCDLCKYSTTTKGNLSIHMQSDKHLNALNDLLSAPTYDQVFKTGATGFDISPNVVGLDGAKFTVNGADGDRDEFRDANDNPSVNADHFHCLICSKFRCSDPQKMMEHLKKDRSFTHLNDIQVSPSSFYCNLCPYGTNLKANFQLHTRTDKHLQRVQLVNHMREGWSSTSDKDVAVSMLSRLSTVKSVVQVRCHLCQETFLCHTTLHEHINSTTHSIRALLVDDSGSVNHIAAVGRSNTPSSGFSTQQLREIFDKLLADRRRFGSTLFTDNLMGYESDTDNDNSPMITTEHNISMSSSSFTIVDVTVDSQLAYRCIPCAAVCYSTDEANEHLATHPEANQQNNEVPSSNEIGIKF